MKKIQALPFLILSIAMLVVNTTGWAQIIVTIPQACDCPTAGSDLSSNGTGMIAAYGAPDCTAGTINGTMTEGEDVTISGVTMTIFANVTTLGSYDITAGPVNGVTFSGTGTFTATGCQEITLTATGTPTAAGNFDYPLNTTPSETVSATVAAPSGPGEVADPPTNLLGTASLSGRTCFDIVESEANDDANGCGPHAARLAQKADFSLQAIYEQTYTFTSTTAVDNIRFVYVNTNGTVLVSLTADADYSGTGFTTATATALYSQDLNTTADATTYPTALTADIYAIYNEGGTDYQVKLTANVRDCACCGAMISDTEWREFLCHNLGADYTLDPHDMSQTNAWGLNGAYVQRGRRGPAGPTGDSRDDWQTAANDGPNGFGAAPTATDPNELIGDWTQASTLSLVDAWRDDIKTANDPCPSGYRVPTRAQWDGVIANNTAFRSGTWSSSITNYNAGLHFGPNASTKTLTLPVAGFYSWTDPQGGLLSRGSVGNYHASTIVTTTSDFSYRLRFWYGGEEGLTLQTRSSSAGGDRNGYSVRCIAE